MSSSFWRNGASAAALGLVIAMSPGAIPAGFQLMAHAQEISESHRQAAHDALNALGTSAKYDAVLLQLSQTIKSELFRTRPDKENQISVLVDDETIKLAPRRGDLEKEIVSIYARNYSEEELKAVAEFFTSEIGKKFLLQTPIVLREVERAAKVWAAGLQRDLKSAVLEQVQKGALN